MLQIFYSCFLVEELILTWCNGSSDRSFMVDPLSYFTFQPVLHDWCNKGHGMCYPVCGMVHIKEPLLLIERVAHVAAAGFLSHFLNGPLQVSEESEMLLYIKMEGRKEMFYLTSHSTHFIYGYMVSTIWLRTILIVRKETCCRHIGYSFRLAARVLLYAASHRQDSTYNSLYYTICGALARTRNSSMGIKMELYLFYSEVVVNQDFVCFISSRITKS